MAQPRKPITTVTGEEGSVRVQVPLHPETVKRIDALADRFEIGRGRMAAMLLEEGLDDNEWVIQVVTSRFMKPVRQLVDGWKGKRQASKEATA